MAYPPKGRQAPCALLAAAPKNISTKVAKWLPFNKTPSVVSLQKKDKEVVGATNETRVQRSERIGASRLEEQNQAAETSNPKDGPKLRCQKRQLACLDFWKTKMVRKATQALHTSLENPVVERVSSAPLFDRPKPRHCATSKGCQSHPWGRQIQATETSCELLVLAVLRRSKGNEGQRLNPDQGVSSKSSMNLGPLIKSRHPSKSHRTSTWIRDPICHDLPATDTWPIVFRRKPKPHYRAGPDLKNGGKGQRHVPIEKGRLDLETESTAPFGRRSCQLPTRLQFPFMFTFGGHLSKRWRGHNRREAVRKPTSLSLTGNHPKSPARIRSMLKSSH